MGNTGLHLAQNCPGPTRTRSYKRTLNNECHLVCSSYVSLSAHTISCLSVSLSLSCIKIYSIYEICSLVRSVPNNIIIAPCSHVINTRRKTCSVWQFITINSTPHDHPLCRCVPRHLARGTARPNAPPSATLTL